MSGGIVGAIGVAVLVVGEGDVTDCGAGVDWRGGGAAQPETSATTRKRAMVMSSASQFFSVGACLYRPVVVNLHPPVQHLAQVSRFPNSTDKTPVSLPCKLCQQISPATDHSPLPIPTAPACATGIPGLIDTLCKRAARRRCPMPFVELLARHSPPSSTQTLPLLPSPSRTRLLVPRVSTHRFGPASCSCLSSDPRSVPLRALPPRAASFRCDAVICSGDSPCLLDFSQSRLNEGEPLVCCIQPGLQHRLGCAESCQYIASVGRPKYPMGPDLENPVSL